MKDWEHLTKHAILGTERQPFSLPQNQSAFSPLWAQLKTKESAEQLLHSAALLTEYRRLGWQPPILEHSPIAPSLPETQPLCTPKAIEYLHTLLQEEDREIQNNLLKEWLFLAQKAGQRTPFDVLPVLLEMGNKHNELRPYLQNTVGQRGDWLAKLNPDWQYLNAQVSEYLEIQTSEIWETGSHEARLAYLRQCRVNDPAKARELVTTVWQQESVQKRQAFLTTFWTNLRLEDEDFLESCFNDRSQVIRQLAAQMLGSLADSRFLKKILERLSSYINVKKGRIKTTLEINLPVTYDKAWTREGIKEKNSNLYYPSMGEKAWWLYQMLLAVRPSFLLMHLNLSTDSYLKFVDKTDFAEMLSHALLVATQTHKDGQVASMLIRQSKPKKFFHALTDFVEILTTDEVESLLKTHLEKTGKKALSELKQRDDLDQWSDFGKVVNRFFPNGLSATISRILLSHNLPVLLQKKEKNWYNLYHTFLLLAISLAPECYQDVQTILEKHTSDEAEPHNAITQFIRIYRFRHQMNQEFT